MAREHYSDLLALVAVAQERSFTKAAAQLGMSQSMLSHTIRQLEARLGVRLLTRTTRSVAVTEAGERLLRAVSPRLDSIAAELVSIADMGSAASGSVRITATDHAIDTLLWPKLEPLLTRHPDIQLELHSDYALIDIIEGRFDFGVRLGDVLSKDITAVRIGPDLQFAIVASPSYFTSRPRVEKPQDLTQHNCINLRLPTNGNLWAWELENDKQQMNVRVSGRLTFNGIYQVLSAALCGQGLAYLPEDLARDHLLTGSLVPVLPQWWITFPGYHLYYSSQRVTSRLMQLFIDGLRHQD
ncbi:LysR family transcriptional regulator [Pantoea sp. Tr-811]|uniref:LysR family transcriptional regulator n=1 Tax=Pantoea sp. Tr-811 TaxID=2608361 RepID=UPI001422862B|nr:LysR family transcriptional regulator [Pantoea sp. Tr-811]NIF24769.1 LysR family transcriptional regulator [Pantoea sp. Tr-811]